MSILEELRAILMEFNYCGMPRHYYCSYLGVTEYYSRTDTTVNILVSLTS